MCGIFGLVCPAGTFEADAVRRAVDALVHRGPDASDLKRYRIGEDTDLWLGHRRLSILDLRAIGTQPFECDDGALVYNGEIYNHGPLRSALRDRWSFRSRTDTEVLLAGLHTEGPRFLGQLNGMLACGYFDRRAGTLTLARDRMGKKPLFTYRRGEIFAFASELKAFHALNLPLTVDEEARAYFRWMGYVPAGRAIFRECSKLLPSTYQVVDLTRPMAAAQPVPYWDRLSGARRRYAGTFDDARHEFSELLDDAVRIRLEADVPVGLFLSGGIDSSLVASSVAEQATVPVRTFTVKPDEGAFDESDVAHDTARRLGIEPEVLHLRQQDYRAQLSRIALHYDEPMADMSQIPVLAVSEAAAKHVTVVLTGDGGDELFLGYPWMAHPAKLWRLRRMLDRVPFSRHVVGRALGRPLGQRMVRAAVAAAGLNTETMDAKLAMLDIVLAHDHPAAAYDVFRANRTMAQLDPADAAWIGRRALVDLVRTWFPHESWDAVEARSLPELLGAIDMVTFMVDDVLTKVDRATMAYGLEARSPLLDYRIVEFALSLPLEFKMHHGEFKRLLRATLVDRLGADSPTITMAKSGFGVPLPEDMEPGPNFSVRWNRWIEQGWSAHWSPAPVPADR